MPENLRKYRVEIRTTDNLLPAIHKEWMTQWPKEFCGGTTFGKDEDIAVYTQRDPRGIEHLDGMYQFIQRLTGKYPKARIVITEEAATPYLPNSILVAREGRTATLYSREVAPNGIDETTVKEIVNRLNATEDASHARAAEWIIKEFFGK